MELMEQAELTSLLPLTLLEIPQAPLLLLLKLKLLLTELAHMDQMIFLDQE